MSRTGKLRPQPFSPVAGFGQEWMDLGYVYLNFFDKSSKSVQ